MFVREFLKKLQSSEKREGGAGKRERERGREREGERGRERERGGGGGTSFDLNMMCNKQGNLTFKSLNYKQY